MSTQHTLLPQEKAGRLIALIGWIGFILMLFFTSFLLYLTNFAIKKNLNLPASNEEYFLFFLGIVVTLVYVFVGRKLKHNIAYLIPSYILLIIAMVVLFPIGTVIGGVAIYYLRQIKK